MSYYCCASELRLTTITALHHLKTASVSKRILRPRFVVANSQSVSFSKFSVLMSTTFISGGWQL